MKVDMTNKATSPRSPAERAEERRRKQREYMRKWRTLHPGADDLYRLRGAVRLVRRAGYTVTEAGGGESE